MQNNHYAQIIIQKKISQAAISCDTLGLGSDAYTRCGAKCCQYCRCYRCYQLDDEFDGFLLCHMLFVFPTDSTNFTDFVPPSAVISSPPYLVISSVVERSLHALRLVEMSKGDTTLSRDDRGGCGLVVGYVVIVAATAAGVTTSAGVTTLVLLLILVTTLGVLDVAAVARGYALQHVAILVKTGNLD